MLRPRHALGSLAVVAAVTAGSIVASAALTTVARPANVTIQARRTNAATLQQAPPELRDMLAAIDVVNAERAVHGLAPLAWHDQVAAAAQAHSLDMATMGSMQHLGSDGSNTGDRLSRVAFNWSGWGETIAAGFSTPVPLVAAWMDSPGHRVQLLGSYRWAGIAVVRSASGVPYWTLVLANGG